MQRQPGLRHKEYQHLQGRPSPGPIPLALASPSVVTLSLDSREKGMSPSFVTAHSGPHQAAVLEGRVQTQAEAPPAGLAACLPQSPHHPHHLISAAAGGRGQAC